jgi:hypothetical protein
MESFSLGQSLEELLSSKQGSAHVHCANLKSYLVCIVEYLFKYTMPCFNGTLWYITS